MSDGPGRIGRRQFLTAVGGGLVLGAVALTGGRGSAAPRSGAPTRVGDGPYGLPVPTPDANGLHLPDGFTSRVVAESTVPVLGPGSYEWHGFPDGGAVFDAPDGGWVYVSNSELPKPSGGAGAVRFAADGTIVDAYRILDGTADNCAGGPTPWGTWLSCEEIEDGHVWECDPMQPGQGVERPLLGTFNHEAAAVDPVGEAVYLTEDEQQSRLYRFLPDRYPDLSEGRLQAARVDRSGAVTWKDVRSTRPARSADTTVFRRGEGMFYDRGTIVFTTTADNRVWSLDTERQQLDVLYDGKALRARPLAKVDNITVHAPSGDLFVAEDSGNLELWVIASRNRRDRPEVAPFVRVAGDLASELAGPAFSPAGDRLYFSSQRGQRNGDLGPGITYEIHGPFRDT